MISVRRQEFKDGIRFGAKTFEVKLFTQILKAVKIRDHATFYCTKKGIKVTVEDARVLQANAYLHKSLFDEYKTKKKDHETCVKFTSNLSVILDCLNILNNPTGNGIVTALLMSVEEEGHPIKLLMEHNRVITECEIKTMNCDPVLNFDFESSTVLNKVVLFSDSFKEVLNDLDTNSIFLTISLSSQPDQFRLTTEGNGLTSHTDIPCDGEMVDFFCCNFASDFSYKLSHLKPALKHLPGSLKVSIRNNHSGILCLQHMVVDEEGHNCFVEFFCSPIFKVTENSGSKIESPDGSKKMPSSPNVCSTNEYTTLADPSC